MASIVELRDMSNVRLEELLENAREEMFNLRFQHAAARLDDLSQLKRVRREIAQYETVLRQRELAVEAALREADVAEALSDQEWSAEAHFDYVESAWQVVFLDGDNKELVSLQVDLNKKKTRGRRARRSVANKA